MALKFPALPFSRSSKRGSDTVTATTILESRDTTTAGDGRSAARAVRPIAEQLRLLGLILGVLVLIIAALLVYQGQTAAETAARITAAGQLRTLSQQIAKSAQLAMQGNQAAINELRTSREQFSTVLGALTDGGDLAGTSVGSGMSVAGDELNALRDKWAISDKDATQVVSQEKNLLTLTRSVAEINKADSDLQDIAEQIVALKLQAGASAKEIASTSRLQVLTQRIAKNANAMLVAAAIDPEVAFMLGRDSNTLRELITQARQSGGEGELKQRVEALDAGAQTTFGAVSGILGNVQLIIQAKQAGSRIFDESSQMLALTEALSERFRQQSGFFSPASLAILALGVLALALLGLMAKTYNDDTAARRIENDRQRASAEEERNMTQQAILRLMNEMGDLADGNLTIRATVSEDITGAIADSVNYTIEELSVLVRRINDAATRVNNATDSARRTSEQLIDATERQAREIETAGSTVQKMAVSMTQASEDAKLSAQVARRSLEAARKGAEAVENTIRGMNAIRDKIQETAKRIKRLGESSQEIGEIVELISDITEQTNVLALNAAIQAATAGDAGRGFTVVAEEVQRLAERSAEATKQISAIVKTIQTDTQDAVGAMENATRDVVSGAELSDAAGQALAEIGQVSNETARMIEQISANTQKQAATASRVAESMKEILAISTQTTRGTQQTAVSVGELSDLAIELKGSVSGFKV